MVYKRVPGGEKTEKTGVLWTKKELDEVYDLFQEIKGEGIHERNPKIHVLSKLIGRSVRSIEAQLLMFRALEKGGNYSHKNMNSISKKVWEEKSYVKEPTINYNLEMKVADINYPHDLLAWAGHQKGGVKTPFQTDNGRPVGVVIETKLVRKLRQWVADIVEKKSVPRILLLVGGPGNGKTDALEFFVEHLDIALNSHPSLYNEFSNCFRASTPRKASAEFNNCNINFTSIQIVPDASVGELGFTKEECLVNDLKHCIENKTTLYISCVNRGIIAKAAEIAEKNNEPVSDFLNKISNYISQDNNNSSLWPIEENKNIALWPMDIESLVEKDKSVDGYDFTPMHLILDMVFEESKWKNCNTCYATELCPFYNNKVDLSNNAAKNNLIDTLRRFEIMSGKRLAFRDIFSLIPFILIGNEDDFKKSTPCNWVKSQLEEMEKNPKLIKSVFDLSSHLYSHRLFSIWPKMTALSKGKRFKDVFAFLKETQTDQLFKILAYRKSDENTFISNLVRTQFSPLLDPANLSGTNLKIESIHKSINEIEDFFSNSIASGFSEVENGLNNLEKAFIRGMIDIEHDLVNIEIQKNLTTQRDFIVNIHKAFICKFVKRSLGVKNGLTNDNEYINEYVNLVDGRDHKELKKYQKLFKKVLNPNEQFIVSLSNTFGQPKSEHSKNILLKVNPISVKLEFSPNNIDNVPRANIPYFEILKKRTPLPYDLFKALMKIDKGINQASLSNEVMAMIDSLISKIGGVIVRDSNYLSNATISIGNRPIEIVLDGGDLDSLEIKQVKKLIFMEEFTRMEEFIQKPTDSSKNNRAYTDSFLNLNTAPEYAIGEVILSSLYRNIGWKNTETGNKYSESSVFKFGGLSNEGIFKRIEKDKREEPNAKIFDNKEFDKILKMFLQSPPTTKQLKSKNLILYPIISDTAIYSSAARMKGNPWNPGSLLEEVIVCGCKDIAEANKVWNDLYTALNSKPEDENEDIWARILSKEFTSWRDNTIVWGDSPNQLSKPAFTFYGYENVQRLNPARQFVEDIKHVIKLKNRLTRKQWISILESLIRIGSASHLLWVCKVNSIIWEYLTNYIGGVPISKQELEERIFERNSIDLKYGENINNVIKKHAREYIIARIGINLLLYKLGDLAANKISSLDDVEKLAQIIISKHDIFSFQQINLEIREMVERDPKLLNCTKGIGNNIFEFIRYSLGQKMTAEVTHKSFDQGYWLKKKGEYSSAPWMLEMGPVAILLLVYCETEPYNFSRTISNLCEHMSNYGISMNPKDIASSKIANTLRSLGLVTDSPDAEGGMVINNPFKI